MNWKNVFYFLHFFFQVTEMIPCTIPVVVQTLVIYKRWKDDDVPLSICEMQVVADEGLRHFAVS